MYSGPQADPTLPKLPHIQPRDRGPCKEIPSVFCSILPGEPAQIIPAAFRGLELTVTKEAGAAGLGLQPSALPSFPTIATPALARSKAIVSGPQPELVQTNKRRCITCHKGIPDYKPVLLLPAVAKSLKEYILWMLRRPWGTHDRLCSESQASLYSLYSLFPYLSNGTHNTMCPVS